MVKLVLTDPIHWWPGPVFSGLASTWFHLGSPASFHTKLLCSLQVRCVFRASNRSIQPTPFTELPAFDQALDRRQMPFGLHPGELTSWEAFRVGRGRGMEQGKEFQRGVPVQRRGETLCLQTFTENDTIEGKSTADYSKGAP